MMDCPIYVLCLSMTFCAHLRVSKGLYDLTGRHNPWYGLAAGNFFSNNVNRTYYAISMQGNKNRTGEVIFLTKCRNMLKVDGNPVTLSGPTGSMFGAAMCAADVSADGLADLLVGAPAHSEDDAGYDAGALFIYLGGDMENIDGGTKRRQRLILSSKDGSRFGTAIAASDINRDGLPEIFISAPYEDLGHGAVYVLSGFDVRNTLMNNDAFKKVFISEFRLTQRIQMSSFRSFGLSLQVVGDVDDNGCDELAIGAPSSGSVILLKCIPTVNVTVSTQLINKIVKEYDSNFTVLVCVNVEYHPKPVDISTQLLVTSKIERNGAVIAKPNFTVDLSQRKERYCENVTVEFSYVESGRYDFSAELDTLLLHEDAYLASKTAFNNTWVTLSPYSKKVSDHLYVTRHCAEDDCSTRLDMSIKWAGTYTKGKDNESTVNYTLGSSETEIVTVLVTNKGGITYDGCVLVRTSGARVSNIACGQDDSGAYRCYLPRPMQRDAEYSINIALNMSKYTSLDKKLHIDALLYHTCNHEDHNRTELDVNFILNAQDIRVTGSSYDINITDTELLNKKIETLINTHEYTIVNDRSVRWANNVAVVTWRKQPFINKYKVSTTENSVCTNKDKDYVIEIYCPLELMPHSTVKIIATTEILKAKIVESLYSNRVDISSNFSLSLRPIPEAIRKSLTTVIFYQKELSFANNKWLIILIAVILALIVLGLVVYVLNKFGFFKRKTRKQLDSLKQSVRSQSVRQSEPGCSEPNLIPEEDNEIDDIDIEVVDDCPFEDNSQQCPTNTADDAALIVEERKKETRKSHS